jgi:hypothetical protein
VQKSIAVDLALLSRYDALIRDLELYLVHQVKEHEISEAAVLFVRHCPEVKPMW